jgi:hypothetical protein
MIQSAPSWSGRLAPATAHQETFLGSIGEEFHHPQHAEHLVRPGHEDPAEGRLLLLYPRHCTGELGTHPELSDFHQVFEPGVAGIHSRVGTDGPAGAHDLRLGQNAPGPDEDHAAVGVDVVGARHPRNLRSVWRTVNGVR